MGRIPSPRERQLWVMGAKIAHSIAGDGEEITVGGKREQLFL